MTRAAVKADRRARARAHSERCKAFLILIDLWDDTAERSLFRAAAYIYETYLLNPETMPRTLGEFLLDYETKFGTLDEAL